MDVRGTWFSGHNASASGIYQVKTTPNSSNRQLKLILRSPAFKDITLNLQFNRDNDKLEIDFKVRELLKRSTDCHLHILITPDVFSLFNCLKSHVLTKTKQVFLYLTEIIWDMFQADHDTNNYCLYLKHTVVSPQETTTQVELKYKAQRYSMLSSVYFGDHRRVSLEFHIDQ